MAQDSRPCLIEVISDGAAVTNLDRFPRECFVLTEFKTEGGVLGRLGPQPIHPFIVDNFGSRYAFAGIAPRRADGSYSLERLNAGEWIIEPGLVYRLLGGRQPWPYKSPPPPRLILALLSRLSRLAALMR